MSRIVCMIPARYGSARLPGKPLLKILDIPLIVWVYRNALSSGIFDEVIVATDDERIAAEVRKEGGTAVMTSSSHASGTDRINEAAAGIRCTHIVNVQGDEPQIPSGLLADFSSALPKIEDNSLLTVVSHATIEEKSDPNIVKAVLDSNGKALYFSRAAIPYERNEGAPCYKHMGIYGYTVAGLRRFCSYREGALEHAEGLEQLRALENGMTIECMVRDFESVGIDTPETLERFRLRMAGNGYGT